MLRCDQERRLQCPSSVATATPVRPARWLVTTHGEAPNDGSCPQNLPCVPPGSGVAAILAAQEARAGRTRSAVNAFAPALPLKLAMMMMLVLLYTPCCLAETITCDSSNECQDDTLTCDNSGPCTVLCSGTQACERATITCPADHDCTITCTGNQVSPGSHVQAGHCLLLLFSSFSDSFTLILYSSLPYLLPSSSPPFVSSFFGSPLLSKACRNFLLSGPSTCGDLTLSCSGGSGVCRKYGSDAAATNSFIRLSQNGKCP